MTRRPRRTVSSNAPTWQRVRGRAVCSEGEGHSIFAPVWALFWPFRHDRARMILCTDHAAARGYNVPALYTMQDDGGSDVKANQAGGE